MAYANLSKPRGYAQGPPEKLQVCQIRRPAPRNPLFSFMWHRDLQIAQLSEDLTFLVPRRRRPSPPRPGRYDAPLAGQSMRPRRAPRGALPGVSLGVRHDPPADVTIRRVVRPIFMPAAGRRLRAGSPRRAGHPPGAHLPVALRAAPSCARSRPRESSDSPRTPDIGGKART